MSNYRLDLKRAQLFISGNCPSNCSYCYINKCDFFDEIDRDIKKRIRDNTLFNKLKTQTGNSLERLTLIGAETSINLDIITNKLNYLDKNFPKLKAIQIYSSLANPVKVKNFIIECGKRGIKVILRVSLSGPRFITDKVDDSGIMSEIPENLLEIISGIKDEKINTDIHWSVTIPIELLNEMAENSELISEYITFFEGLNERIAKSHNNPSINLDFRYNPNVANKGNFTKENGKKLALFVQEARKKNLFLQRNSIVSDFLKKDKILASDFSCYAGNTSITVGKNNHPCGTTFLYDRNKYIEEAFNDEDSKKGAGKLKNSLIFNTDKGKRKSQYLISCHNDYLKFRMESVKGLVEEMVKEDQVNKRYLKEEWALLILKFSSCIVNSTTSEKSIYIPSSSMLKLYGNGAIKEMVDVSLNNFNYD